MNDPAGPPDIGPLPADAILLHLGFHKTGTTALQSIFAANREVLREHGVLYPGKRRSHHPAAMAMTNRTWGVGREGGWDPDPRAWQRLARSATRHPGRVLISSESFALTSDEAAATMVDDLGPERVHVAFTLRPVAELLSSSWQQYLRSGWTTTYEQWLAQIVAELEPGARRSGFWLRNDYPRIIGRWASLVGPQRVHLVCLDGTDRDHLLRTFRGLLGIPDGVLDTSVADANRSMTAAEAELLRALNEVSSDWDWPTYQRTVRAGAAAGIVESRRPGPDEPPIVTPITVSRRAAEFGRAAAASVAELGVVVHGDLGVLGRDAPGGTAEPGPAPTQVAIAVAVAAVLGAIRGAQRQAAEERPAPASVQPSAAVQTGDAAQLGNSVQPSNSAPTRPGDAPRSTAQASTGAGLPITTGLPGRVRRATRRRISRWRQRR